MQSMDWYIKRLRAMSAGEVAWRIRSALRDATDRCRYPSRRRAAAAPPAAAAERIARTGFAVAPRADELARMSDQEPARGWIADLRARADRITAHRVDLFDLDECFLGDPIRWNRDHKAGIDAPLTFAPSIDYRDQARSGDCKFVWEPSRHQHLVVLARAYRATGEARYARAAAHQLQSWLDACPFGLGMNWRSPLELAIRLINWVWTLDLIRPAGVVDEPLAARLAESVDLHLWEITRKYSRGSSANNHLVGEAAGVFIATCYFPGVTRAKSRHDQARDLLLREIDGQMYEDGGNREHAMGYHFFVLEMFLLAGIVGRASGDDLPLRYWSSVAKMIDFAAVMCAGGPPPSFGDADDGYLLDLEDRRRDPRWLLDIGARVCGRRIDSVAPRPACQAAYWLPIPATAERISSEPARLLTSRGLRESGYYLLQSGRRDSDEAISVLFDCGDLGFGAIAAHGHADALSFTLRAFGLDILVDPGTYDYFSFDAWRAYFRGTRAHNTIEVDGVDQSVMLGKFLWGTRAAATCVDWSPGTEISSVTGEHDGYTRLDDPVRHRRKISLDAARREVTIEDQIIARGRHELRWYAHLGENCRVQRLSDHRFEVTTGRGSVIMDFDQRLSWTEIRASLDPIGGWISRGYHRKDPSTTLRGLIAAEGNLTLVSKLAIGPVDGNWAAGRERERALGG